MAVLLYLATVLLAALLGGATWMALMWGISLAALFPLYLFGLVIAAALIVGAKKARKLPHA